MSISNRIIVEIPYQRIHGGLGCDHVTLVALSLWLSTALTSAMAVLFRSKHPNQEMCDVTLQVVG